MSTVKPDLNRGGIWPSVKDTDTEDPRTWSAKDTATALKAMAGAHRSPFGRRVIERAAELLGDGVMLWPCEVDPTDTDDETGEPWAYVPPEAFEVLADALDGNEAIENEIEHAAAMWTMNEPQKGAAKDAFRFALRALAHTIGACRKIAKG